MASALNVFSHPEYCSFYFFLYKYLPLIFSFLFFFGLGLEGLG